MRSYVLRMIEHFDPNTWRRPNQAYPRKHTLGPAACAYCQDGNHHRCRPRLDKTFCTCSCDTAVEMRAEAAEYPDLSENEQVEKLASLGLTPLTRTMKYEDEDDVFGTTCPLPQLPQTRPRRYSRFSH
jgi:hypothetical protein